MVDSWMELIRFSFILVLCGFSRQKYEILEGSVVVLVRGS